MLRLFWLAVLGLEAVACAVEVGMMNGLPAELPVEERWSTMPTGGHAAPRSPEEMMMPFDSCNIDKVAAHRRRRKRALLSLTWGVFALTAAALLFVGSDKLLSAPPKGPEGRDFSSSEEDTPVS